MSTYGTDGVDDVIEHESEEPSLSVVVPVYNEASHIRDCIESVLTACRAAGPYEVVVVDSNSTDRTVDIASEYPVTVVRIPDDDLTSPGAGRYVGTAVASGDQLLFVDGDITLESGWLRDAQAVLAQSGVAGVDGHLNNAGDARTTETVESINGVALYCRDALSAVGGFDPYLNSLEDIDVGFRLRAAGFELRRLPTVVGSHPPAEGPTEIRRRWHNGYFFGIGQALQRSVSMPRVLARHLWRLRFKLAVVGWLTLGLVTLLSVPVAVFWIASSVLVFLVESSKRGLTDATVEAFGYLLVPAGLLRGATMELPPRESFPLDRVETVSDGSVLS